MDFGSLKIATHSLLTLLLKSSMYILSPPIWVGFMICYNQQNMAEVMLGQLLDLAKA